MCYFDNGRWLDCLAVSDCLAAFSFIALESNGQTPAREKSATPCLGVNGDEYSSLNNNGKSIFRRVLLPFRTKHLVTIRFHDCFAELRLQSIHDLIKRSFEELSEVLVSKIE